MTFQELYFKVQKGKEPPKRLLAIDPGHMTGWAIFDNGDLVDWGQSETVVENKVCWGAVKSLITYHEPTHIICENYKIYKHKLEQHSGSEVLTLRIIGVLDFLCYEYQIPIHYQMALEHKGFCTDEKLKQWNYWKKGMRHSRDAIRAGCYYLLFHRGEYICKIK